MLQTNIETLSYQGALAYGRQVLTDSSDSAALDAKVLLLFVINQTESYLLTWPEKAMTAEQIVTYKGLLKRRQQSEPVAYLTGEKEFWSLMLEVSPATLIPRPDTEVLVELVLQQHIDKKLKCLDLGTGTGAIALALASEQPDWQIEAIDFNPDAVALAQRNAAKHHLTHVNIYQSDWFSQVSEASSFDVIVSNPPYIDETDPHLAQGDVVFEPNSALVASNQGLADIHLIVEQAKVFLLNSGWLYLEHGYQQSSQVQDIMRLAGYYQINTQQDYAGNDRVTYGQYICSK